MDNNPNEFIGLIKDLLKEHGLELPKIPDTPSRQAYLELLASLGYSEDELLPIIEKDRMTGIMHGATISALLSAIKSENPQELLLTAWVAYNTVTGADNTNLIIYQLAEKLKNDISLINITLPDFYAGVFPTNSINAQCKIFNSENIILIDTGCMEMSEALVKTFVSKNSLEERIEVVEVIINEYIEKRIRPNPLDIPNERINWGSGVVPLFVNSFQKFVISHEIGHLFLKHVKTTEVNDVLLRDGTHMDFLSKSILQEYQADIWACKVLIDSAKKETNSNNIDVALLGPYMFLYTAMFLEAMYKRKGLKILQDHPSASDRLYMIDVVYELLGVHENKGIVRKFRGFALSILEECFPEVEAPPLLARDLNKILIKVLDSLNIDYKHANYITDFD